MIAILSRRHTQKIASLCASLFFATMVLPASGRNRYNRVENDYPFYGSAADIKSGRELTASNTLRMPSPTNLRQSLPNKTEHKPDIGGPGQPEMASFKSVEAGNMVNLFTGDFSYNIPLLDVGGYPLNIYYSGGISMEQEASWVGLGWNLNPGNINRNVRGVPDDFNGSDTLKQMQKMKPNRTWGLGIGADAELFGIKAPVNAELGVAFNNYLGPSLDLTLRGSVAYKASGSAGSEKMGFSAGVNLGLDINSRNGTSFSGGVSLNANSQSKNNSLGFGTGLSTAYNSRSGIKAIQISEQVSFSNAATRNIGDPLSASYSNPITFAKPSYIPSLRLPITNSSWSGHFQLGLGSYGIAADVEAEVYGQKSEIANGDTLQKKFMVGYLYLQNAVNNPNYVMDFTRFNDREVTPKTPIISVPQYSYDVFSIQGEGTGGSIRAYRNDLGYVRDNNTTSKDKNISLGGDVDPPGHYGGNFNTVRTPSTIGEWGNGNKLRNSIQFKSDNTTFENVYFRNPDENSVIDPYRYSKIGGTSLVRYAIAGSGNSPTIEPKLQMFDSLGKLNSTTLDSLPYYQPSRNKRTQVVNFLNAAEASNVGLDVVIKSFDNQSFLDAVKDTLLYESIPRVGGIRKAHHISQINVTESNGRRYVYGIPVYNIIQKDFTFSVDPTYSSVPDKAFADMNLVNSTSRLMSSNTYDGYVQVTTTPAYAHSFLLSGILSPDYVDVTGNGISEDDLGTAVKFNYSRIKVGGLVNHKWRTPLTLMDSANFNAGLRSETKDDKAIISYGERESWYLHSVESKTMIALFYVSNRQDGKGPYDETGGINSADNFLKELDSIALFSKADLKANGLAKAKPIKTVHFSYVYLLCQGTKDDPGGLAGNKGKLTLQNIYFTYNGKTRSFKNRYSFTYNYTGANNDNDNPIYAFNSSDRWGTYKPQSLNPGSLSNADYPYTPQDIANKPTVDQNASAWMLKKIILPSGGQFDITYEADDYAYVQNRRATEMMKIAGFSSSNDYTTASDKLYPYQFTTSENDYVFIQVPTACNTTTDVYNYYLQGMAQLAFRVWVNMPKGPEFITSYANFSSGNYGVVSTNHNIIWVKMNRINGMSPVSLSALEYLRQQLPGQAFPGYDIAGEPGLKQVGDMLLGMLSGLKDAFTNPTIAFRKAGKAMHTDLTKSFVRLNDPDGIKYGGGYRVKSVRIKDNWNAMTGQYTATYGQDYNYTTTENLNGALRTISSGVASYEPSIGGEENPFQSILLVEDDLPAGPASYGAIEMPVLDAFFPAPVVGYSKVTVTSMKADTTGGKKSRSGIGKQVTEFYTAKDFPTYYSYTPFDGSSVKEFHQAFTLSFFSRYAYDFKAQSQGFLVATNDMHGKMKSQSSYAENDTATRINYTENFYRNTGGNGLNEKFSFISNSNGGGVSQGNMGIDVDLMTDTREFSVKGSSLEVQGQVDIIYLLYLIIPIPTFWPVVGASENTYRSVTTTKVVNYHSVLDSVVVIDKGSQVSTKNMAFDAETGEVLVSRTNNEFNQPVYSASYPAYWAYGGMGLAYKNINQLLSGINFSDGKITNASFDFSVFESGDEILITDPGSTGTGCDATIVSNPNIKLIWAFDKNKNTTSLITTPDFIFIDGKGVPYTRANVSMRIIRSGKRNLLDAKVATITSLDNPLATGKLTLNSTNKIVNATAVEYKEKWFTDNDAFGRYKLVLVGCNYVEQPDILGYLENKINPYRKKLVGDFRPFRTLVFYDVRKEYDTTAVTNIATNGQLKNFKLYWDFNASNNLVPDYSSAQWVWNNKINKVNGKGLELETQDALNIYTAAEYGYNKTMPVAIANNARMNEMFAENFEDYGYGESLDSTSFNFNNRHIDFSGISNSSIINTDATTFRAHSGKYVLGVTSTATVNIPIQLQPDTTSGPSFVYTKDTTKTLNVLGGTYLLSMVSPKIADGGHQGTATFNTASPGFNVTLQPMDTFNAPGRHRFHYYTVSGAFYISITTANTYNFNYGMGTAYNNANDTVFVHSNGLNVMLTDSVGNLVDNHSLSQNGFTYTLDYYSVYLCPGTYLVSYSATELYNASDNGLNYTSNNYSWGCSNSTSPDYKNLNKTAGCTFTKPLSGSLSQQNPLFSVPAGKKMVVSGWVREDCGNPAAGIPCKDYTYSHNQVLIRFLGGTITTLTISPDGPIIDGWQRFEGTFTVPAGATSVELNLMNTGTGTVYFDDLRMHPFNSNVKSYVYDPVNLRLVAELDPNNYTTFYEYDEEGTLIRTKAETKDGIKTITETRQGLQKVIQ